MASLKNIILVVLGLAIGAPLVAWGVTIYPAGDFLQPGDVTSSHIEDGTIVNADISTAAAVDLNKIDSGSGGKHVVFDNYGTLGTSTALEYATSTNTLWVHGGTLAATTTNLNGVTYSWPSSDGTSGQVASTDGAGAISWQSTQSSTLTYSLTAGLDLNTGDAVALGVAGSTTSTIGSSASNQTISTSAWHAQSFTTPATLFEGITQVKMGCFGYSSGPAPAMKIWIYSDNGGVPGTLISDSSTADNNCSGGGTLNVTATMDSAALTLLPNTTYWVVIDQQNNSVSNTIYVYNTNTAAQAKTSTDSGSNWTDIAGPLYVEYTYVQQSAGKAYCADASTNNNLANAFLGLVTATTTSGNTVTVDTWGASTATTSLTAATLYYLSDTACQLSATTGTQTRKVGVSLGTDGFLLRPENP